MQKHKPVWVFAIDIGRGVQKNYYKAVEWYTKAAEKGDMLAQYNLGICYEHGRGVTKNYNKAVEWYTKAAQQGYEGAENNLGTCYRYGRGVPNDDSKAVKWYTKAAEKGYTLAQYNLGVCYEFGHGVTKDYDKAIEWYTLAALKGFESAQKALERLNLQVPSILCQGFVKDKEGTPIIGASILIEGTSTGTVSNLDGYFQLEAANKGDRIQIAYIGYKTRTIEWDGSSFLNIKLTEK